MKINILIFLLLVIASCKRDNETINPKVKDITESVYASAVIKSKNQYQLFSTVNGLIQEILVNEGDIVSEGAPLMKVLNEPSRLNTRNAQLAADYSDLQANEHKLKEAKISIDLAWSKMKNDSLLFVRQRNLRSRGIGNLIELEQRELAYKNAVTNHEVARLHYRDLKRQLEFTSNQAKTTLKISTVVAGDYLIKAESKGKVYKILKEKGELANTITPVAILGDADEFLIEMKVDEYDISRIREGQRVVFTMDSYKGEVFEATVSKISPLMNEESRTFTVKGIFVTKPDVLYPNLSAEANIFIRSKENALTIPRSCVIGDSMVIMANGEMRKVIVGLKDYRKAEIISGLSVDDKIEKPKP